LGQLLSKQRSILGSFKYVKSVHFEYSACISSFGWQDAKSPPLVQLWFSDQGSCRI